MALKKDKKDPKILLVFDNPKERNNLSSRLRVQGFNVEAATGGFHSIHLLEKNSYDLLMVIEDMEDMPGLEVVALARNIRSKEELPILALSKSTNQEDLIEMIDMGANEYQVYSQNFNAILQAIKKVCP